METLKLIKNQEGEICEVCESMLLPEKIFLRPLPEAELNQARQIFEEKKREAEALNNRKDDLDAELAELESNLNELMEEVIALELVFPDRPEPVVEEVVNPNQPQQ